MHGQRMMKFFLSMALIGSNASWAMPVDDGDLDLTFGVGGKRVFGLGGNEAAAQVVVAADGSLYLAGMAVPGFSVAKLDSAGDLSPEFPARAYPGPEASAWFFAQAAALAPDGTLLVAGAYAPTHYVADWHWVLCRFDASGAAVVEFGDGNVAPGCATDFSNGMPLRGEIRDIAVRADGRIVIAGHVVDDIGQRRAAVTRINVDGTTDASFSTTIETLPNIVLPVGSEHESLLEGLTLGANGDIIVAGNVVLSHTDSNILVARLSADGLLDAGFADNGLSIHAIDLDEIARVDIGSEVIEMPDGSIFVAGSAENEDSSEYGDTKRRAGVVLALTSNGRSQQAFGTGGRVVLHEADGNMRFYGIADAGNGRVYVAGSRGDVFNDKPALFRLDPQGQIDSSFGGENGVVFAFSPDDTNAGITDVVVHNGQVIVAGYALDWGNQDLAVARFGNLLVFSDSMELQMP